MRVRLDAGCADTRPPSSLSLPGFMSSMPNNAADPWDAIRADAGLLAWYVASGADECHLDSPVDRLAKA
ncbi:MAG TPA: hypothetical protein VIK87_11965, partial [Sphingomonadales bacterium]